MKNLLIQLNQRPIAVYPIYIKITGSVNAGLLLSQLMYWYGAMNGKIFYKTDAEIMEETCLSESELRTAKNKLKSMSFIEIKAKGVPAKTYYSINAEKLISEIHNFSSAKSTKLKTRNQRNSNSEFNETITKNTTENTTKNTTDISFENEFSTFEKITIDDSQSSKVNPFTIVAKLQGEKEKSKSCGKKEKEKADAEPKPERKPNPTYEAFTVFCQTFEQLSGAAYPTDQKGHYIMSPKDAGGMVYLLRWLEKVDRNNDTNEALKVFLQAAWSLPDKWLKANFTPPILYGQANKVYTAYQTSSPAAKKKAYDDEADRLLNEYIQTLKQTQ
jgi:hypothetical protein